MKAKIKFNSLISEIEITKENTLDFIEYIKKISHKPEVKVQKLLNDPNPIMCYVGNKRVIPGTDIPLEVETYPLNDLLDKSSSAVIFETELEGYRFINLTPHNVVFFYNKRNEKIIMNPSADPIRVYTEFEKDTNDLSIFNKQKKMRVQLPEPVEGVVYVVSQVVWTLLPERKDLVYPNSVHAVRDDNGNVIGVHAFIER